MTEWGKGYDAGQIGLVKAVETARLMGATQERERIIKLLEELIQQIKGTK